MDSLSYNDVVGATVTCLKFLVPICFFMLAATAQAGLQETIAHIEQLLRGGKTVALLLVDMQTGFIVDSYVSEFSRIVEYQAALLDYFAKNDSVYFIDVNYETQGPTISYLRDKLKTNQYYQLFMKNRDSAFKSKIIPKPGEQESEEQISRTLNDYLDSEKIKHLVITGCFDAACIFKTARDAVRMGYKVMVDREMNMMTKIESDSYPPGETAEQAATRRRKLWIELQDKYPDRLTVIQPATQGTCEAATP